MVSIWHHIIHRFVRAETSIAPLVTFRILFGLLMAIGSIRFIAQGWVEKLYGTPQFFFKFPGFEWVTTPDVTIVYGVYILIALSALGIAAGLFYRLSAILFFLSFTYSELLDATNYLNHYYLVCLLAFWMIFLPAARAFSLDVWRKKVSGNFKVPSWTINVLLFQIGTVYFFAGLAKLNSDWLFHAMPLAAWLPEHQDLPVIGYFFQFKWTAFAFSWMGAFYDLTVAFFLLHRRTRPFAYGAVVLFHLLTGLLFNIGLFPVIMITSTLLFFSADQHQKWLALLGYQERPTLPEKRSNWLWIGKFVLPIYIVIQLALPLRHWLYPGDVLWTEEGYRFSWRVMLVEKSGQITFTVSDPETGRSSEIVNGNYLTRFQEKQMAIQPDFMLQFADFLKQEFQSKYDIAMPIVTAEAHVALNGRVSRPFIIPDTDLSATTTSLKPFSWIIRYN